MYGLLQETNPPMVDFGGKGHEEEGTAKQALVREALESTNERVAEQDSVPVFVLR